MPGTILQITQHGGLTSSAAVNPPQLKSSPSQPNPSPPQPVDIVGSKKFFCQLRNTFRVVILHEPMTIREDMYERQQHPLKDVDINFLNHNSLEYTYARGSLLADRCPDMHLHRMLCPVDVCQQCRGKQELAYSTSISKALMLSPENKLLRQGNIHAKITI